MSKIVARGVFDESGIAIQQCSSASDHFHTCNPVTGQAIADDLNAACVGGHITANLRGAGGCKIYGIKKPLLLGEGLQIPGDNPGLAGNDAILGGEIQNFIHAVKGHYDFTLTGHGAAG